MPATVRIELDGDEGRGPKGSSDPGREPAPDDAAAGALVRSAAALEAAARALAMPKPAAVGFGPSPYVTPPWAGKVRARSEPRDGSRVGPGEVDVEVRGESGDFEPMRFPRPVPPKPRGAPPDPLGDWAFDGGKPPGPWGAMPRPAPVGLPKVEKFDPFHDWAFGGGGGSPRGRGELSKVPAFDRPQPVVIVGPRPVPVSVVGGGTGGGAPPGGGTAPKKGVNWGSVGVGAVRGFGAAAEGVAQNRVLPAITGAVKAAASGLEMLGPYGRAAGAALRVAAEAATAFSQVTNAFVARGRELQGYSGQIAGAAAQADIRKMMSDMREADKLGEGFSKLIEAQSKLDATVNTLLRPIKEVVIEVLTKALDAITRQLLGNLEALNKLLEFFGVEWELLKDLIKEVRNIMKGEDAGLDKLWALYLDAPGRAAPPAAVPVGRPVVPGVRIPGP